MNTKQTNSSGLARRDILKAGGALFVSFAVPFSLIAGVSPAHARGSNRPP